MEISYELNPPKIIKSERFDLAQLNDDMHFMLKRASQIAGLVKEIHITDSVLGIPRVSSITAASYIINNAKIENAAMKFSCSIRVRDRNFTSLCQAVSDSILAGIDSLLLLMGDEPTDNASSNFGLKPSSAVKMLKKDGYDSKIKLNLSFPAKIDTNNTNNNIFSRSIQNKLDARPHCFITQSIASLSDLGQIVDLAKAYGIRVAAVIMVPTEKNRQSASIIGLDWSGYEKNPVDFVRQAATMADSVLLTSPNSLNSGIELLQQLLDD